MAAKTVNGIPFNGQDLTGLKFNRLTVLRLHEMRRGLDLSRSPKPVWECLCECGNTTHVLGEGIKSGHIKSCGCFKIERTIEYFTKHGLAAGNRHPLYSKWEGLVKRTENLKSAYWKDYGGRGIKICERWRKDAGAFYKDMFPTWVRGLMVDRKNNDGHYSCGKCDECVRNGWPMNCQWATMKQQARNRRSNRIIEVDGVKKPLFYWEEKNGLKPGLFYCRIYRGWSESDAVTIPAGGGRRIEVKAEPILP